MNTHSSTSRVLLCGLLTGLITIALSLSSFTSAQDRPDPKPRSSQNDERLKKLLDRFPQADTDKDGVLSMKEARDFVPKLQELRKRQRGRRVNPAANRPEPTRPNVKYGPHERNVFDLWLPEDASADNPPPVVVYFHGGGFVGGDKTNFNPTPYLKMGYAVASSNYRFVNGKDVVAPVPMQDAARAVQFLRQNAKDFGIDSDKMALSGGSAGAVITMWIAFHDDLADPNADDPVLRQSTRVSCIVPFNGPTNLDPVWIHENLGGPDQPHPCMSRFYGVDDSDYRSERVKKLAEAVSPIHLATADDPPAMLIYGGSLGNLPLPEDAANGVRIHHPYFGKVLKDKLDGLGVECQFHPGDRQPYEEIGKFLNKHLR